MIKYGLKEENLLRKLDEWNGCLFEDALQEECEKQYRDNSFFITINVGRLLIPKNEISIDSQYDPTSWNEFPEITPPEHVAMRVETKNGHGEQAYFIDGHWCLFDAPTAEDGSILASIVVRFRPWIGPDEDEGKGVGF